MSKKVIIGLSGGVDSAVSCYLLKQQGYDVEAIFMQNWDSYVNHENNNIETSDKCEYQLDYDDALAVANFLKIKLHKIDFIDQYWKHVFESFIADYKKGWTPNPDVLCNKYIKFGSFLDYVNKHFDFDYIAMGHYAKTKTVNNITYLLQAKDKNKDQTYFLAELHQNQLKKTIFPIGDLTKQEVRQIAYDIKIPVWNKKDSVGICFIGKRNFSSFLSNYIANTPGKIIDIETNQVLGDHLGISFYTIGQNNNLKLGGMKSKYFVCKKDIKNNFIYVACEQLKNKYLVSNYCVCENFNWIVKPQSLTNLKVRFRHRQELIDCKIKIIGNQVHIYYKTGSLAVTLGQYAVLYDLDVCLGGGQVCSIALQGENNE